MLRPRRYPLLVRLARFDRELSDAARLVGWLLDDVREAREALIDSQDRITIVLAVTGALAMANGARGPGCRRLDFGHDGRVRPG